MVSNTFYLYHFVPLGKSSNLVYSIYIYIGVSKNRGGSPKWMVKIMENPMNKWMIWGEFSPYFCFNTHMAYISQTGSVSTSTRPQDPPAPWQLVEAKRNGDGSFNNRLLPAVHMICIYIYV